jgi:hypothetical protein
MSDQTNSQVLYSWTAPLRPFKKHSGSLLRFFFAVSLIISLFMVLFGDLITLLVVWSLMFLFYVFAITTPPTVENKITVFGVETAGVTIRWDALSHYYFTKRFGFTVLNLVGHPPYNAHIYVTIDSPQTKAVITPILNEHVVFLSKPPTSFVDRLVQIMSKVVPDDDVQPSRA